MMHSLRTVVWTTQTPVTKPRIEVEWSGETRCEADTSDGGVCLTRLFPFDEHCPNEWQHWHGTEAAE